MNKPRVLLAGHLPPPLGGIATLCQALLGSPLAEGTELRFVQTSSQRRDFSSSGLPTWSNLVEAVRDGLRFWRAFREHRPQFVHICTAQGLSFFKNSLYVAIARLSGRPVLLHPHCSLSKLYGRNPLWRLFCHGVFRLSSGVLGISREWLSLGQSLPGLKVFYRPNAIDIRPYREIALRRARPKKPAVHLLYLGYLGKDKGTYDLVEAFRSLDPGESGIVLHLVGEFLTPDDPERLDRLAAEATAPGKVCSLEKPVSGPAKLACFENADVFVFPSHDEGLPVALLEAMASGLPVAATRVGGIPDLITDGVNGLLTAPREPAALAGSLRTLIKDERLRLEFGSRNAADSERHDIRPYAEALMEIYGTLLADRR